MHDAQPVGVRQGVGDLFPDGDGPVEPDRTGCQNVCEGRTPREVEHEVRDAVVGAPAAEAHQARMVEPGQDGDLRPEPEVTAGLGAAQQLDRHRRRSVAVSAARNTSAIPPRPSSSRDDVAPVDHVTGGGHGTTIPCGAMPDPAPRT